MERHPLEKARTEAGLSQSELARRAECKPHHVSEIESGKRPFGLKLAMRFSKLLNVRISELLALENF